MPLQYKMKHFSYRETSFGNAGEITDEEINEYFASMIGWDLRNFITSRDGDLHEIYVIMSKAIPEPEPEPEPEEEAGQL